MNWGMIIAGFVFLANPVINVVDILPDAIGFFLIAAGMAKSSYFIGEISKSRETFIKLGFLETVKFFSIVLIPYISGSGKLLLSFVFGVIELMWILPAVTAMFEGLSFMGLWYGGGAIFAKKVKKKGKVKTAGKEKINSVKDYIIFFYIVRIAATIFPELTELQMYDNVGEVSAFTVRLINYKPTLYVLMAFLVSVCGIILIVKTAGYFGVIGKDASLKKALDDKYKNDILTNTTMFLAKNMKTALIVYIFSAICEFVISADGVNLIIGVIPSSLLIVSACIMMKYAKKAALVIPFAGVRAALAVVNLILQIKYYGEYNIDAVDWISAAHDSYYRLAALNAVENVVALASVVLYLSVLLFAVKEHLSVCGIVTESTQYSKKNRDLETYNIIGGKLLMCTILAIVNYVFAALYNYMAVNVSLTTLIDSVITLIYIAYVVYTVNTINELLYDKELELS